MIGGVCRFCSCTHLRPCPGGCAWADEEETICTACLPRLSDPELAQLCAPLLAEESVRRWSVTVPMSELLAATGMIQLVLRQLAGGVVEFPEELLAAVELESFVNRVEGALTNASPLVAELIRRGEPQLVEPSRLIIP